MATNTYTGSVSGPIVVKNGDEADLNGATLTSANNNNGVTGLGAVTVRLAHSSITADNRGITDDAAGTLTVSLDSSSSITGSDGIGSDSAVIALVNAGTIQSNASSNGGGFISRQSGSTILNLGTGTISGGSGAYAINAAAAATITNAGTITAGTAGALRFEAGGGTLNLSDGATAGTITGGIVTNGALTVSNNGVATYGLASVISGSGSLRVIGGGTLTLSNTNTYTGGTTVTGGATLVANHTDPGGGGIDALGSGAVTLDNGVLSNGTGNGVGNAVIVGAGGATLAGTQFTFNGGFSGAGAVTFATSVGLNGADTRTQGATVLAGNVTVTASRPSGLSAQSDFSVATGALLRLTSGGQAQTYTVGSLSGAGTVSADSIVRPSTTTLSLGAPGASTTFSGVLQDGLGLLALTKTGAGVFTLTGANTYTGTTTISGGVLRIGNGGTAGSITGAVTDNAVLQFSRSDATTFAGAISGSGSVLVDSGGTLTLSGANTYTGGTTVTGGATSLTAAHATIGTIDALGTGAVSLEGVLRLAASGTLANAIQVSGFNPEIDAATSATLSGPISGSSLFLSIVPASGGTLTFTSAANSYRGTVVTATPTFAAPGVPNAPGTLVLAAQDVFNANDFIRGGSNLVLQASQTFGGLADDASISGAPPMGVVTLTVGALGVSSAFNGVISGALSLAKVGGGALTLTAASTYTGATTVSGGVLAVDGSLTSAVTVASGGTLRGTGTDTAGVTVRAGGTFAPGEGAGAFTVGGALSLGAGSTFADTAASATAYGTANVAGLVTLGGSLNFNVTSAAVLPVGTSFTLVHETGATAVAGAFANAADGSSYTTASGYSFRVSYSGGVGGHDVVLTETAAPSLPVTDAQTTSATTDKATATPFAGVTVTDPAGGAETARITYAAADGALTLTGAGATLTGSAGAYTLTAASDAALNAALRALVFTPTPNQVAGGATIATTFTTSLSDAAGRMAGAVDTTTVTGVNDAPTISGAPASATAPSGAAVTLAPGLVIADPDAGAMATSAQVAIGAGFTVGDRLAVTNTPANVTATYNAATGVLTLTGTASDAAYATALEHVSFSHDGTVNAGTRAVSFTVTDDQGAASQPVTETVTVGGYVQPTTGGSATPPTNLDVQQGFPTQFDNLVRAAPNDPAFSTPTSPLYAQAQAEKGIAAQLDSGQIGLADAQNALYHLVDGTTSVAEISYVFFTGATPTQAGLNYLVHSSANPTDLNDSYYQQFSTENRYINFANNLATGVGAGAAAFQANYGSLSLGDAVTKAYAAVFGFAPAAGKVDAILNAQVSNGLGGTETRAQYFADITGGSAASQKAAAIGFLLADSVKEGFGAYQQADLHFLQDLAHGTAVYNVDLLSAYAQAPTLVGQPVIDSTLGS